MSVIKENCEKVSAIYKLNVTLNLKTKFRYVYNSEKPKSTVCALHNVSSYYIRCTVK